MTEVKSYRDLLVWQEAIDLAVHVYELTKSFPRDEIYGLTSQLRRASVSISSNIAEGYGRDTTGAYVNHLKIARGSINEVESLLEVCNRVGLFAAGRATSTAQQADKLNRMLSSLIRSVESNPRDSSPKPKA